MKKSVIRVLAFSATVLFWTSVCSAQTTPKKKAVPPAKKTAAAPAKPVQVTPSAADIADGKAMISKSDCLACHKVDAKLIGPAYIDVAKKYPDTEANYALLTSKILAGGSGVWGQIPMAAHPQLQSADVKKIVQYILSLN